MAKNLIIKTTMDNKDFESKYNDLTRQLQTAESKLESSKAKLGTYQKELQDVSRQYEIMGEEAERTFNKIAEFERKMNDPNGSVTAMETMDYNDMVKSYEKMSTYLNQLEKQQDGLTNKVASASSQVMSAENNVSKIANKMKEIEETSNQIDFSKIGNGMEKLVKKVAKWGLALVGIRSAYNAIRMSINTMTQYDEQLKTDMEYLQYALAMSLKPIIDAIVPLIFKALNFINQIVYSITGVNLFANSMAKGFESSNKSAKELRKTLAGFDTATVLNDSGTGTGVGGGSTGVSPQYNLGEVDDTDLVTSLDKVFTKLQNKVYGFLGNIKKNILDTISGTDWFTPVSLIIDGIQNIIGGIGGFIGDIFALIIGICTGNFNLIRQSFIDMFNHIVQVLKGLGQIVWGVLIGVFDIFVWLGREVGKAMREAVDGIKFIFGAIGDWIYQKVIKPIGDKFVGLGKDIKGIFTSVADFFSSIWGKIKTTAVEWGTKIGDSFASAFKSVINWVLQKAESILNVPIKGINAVIKEINKIPGVDMNKLQTFSLPRLATGGIINNPGKGVPIGGAIGGEAGREGVIPLTDSQAMAQLGREIGQWISVNVDLTTKLDGRILSRSLEKIKDTNSFVRNGV